MEMVGGVSSLSASSPAPARLRQLWHGVYFWYPLNVVTGGTTAKIMLAAKDNFLGKYIYKDTLARNLAAVIYKDEDEIIDTAKEQYRVLKTENEFRYGYKVVENANLRSALTTSNVIELPKKEELKTVVDKVKDFFGDVTSGAKESFGQITGTVSKEAEAPVEEEKPWVKRRNERKRKQKEKQQQNQGSKRREFHLGAEVENKAHVSSISKYTIRHQKIAAPRGRKMGAVDAAGGGEVDVFDAGRCADGYALGLAVGRRFGEAIRSRMRGDAVLRQQLLPFAATAPGRPRRGANRARYPRYWDELVGTADGSGVPLLHVILVNFRKEILPFITNEDHHHDEEEADDDCSDVLLVSESTAIAGHNEDANVALLGHTYVVKATSPDGSSSFTAYTYAGELPTCAFGFNSNGVAFTLDSVPPARGEVVAGAIARNFVSRDLLEATSLDDAMNTVTSPDMSVGHSYNLMDVRRRRIVNVETASGRRFSVREAGAAPFFHANMYRHLQVEQVHDENSMARERRAAEWSPDSKEKALSLLGDTADGKYPIYMTGPTLYTLCTVLVDLDEETMTIYKGNPMNRDAVRVFRML
uniref:Peptidase C45 hydrolase domain-containing protein n=1 Tax=Oryza brachyantha TaxID=4533 RepID=J3LEH0_ORYBR